MSFILPKTFLHRLSYFIQFDCMRVCDFRYISFPFFLFVVVVAAAFCCCCCCSFWWYLHMLSIPICKMMSILYSIDQKYIKNDKNNETKSMKSTHSHITTSISNQVESSWNQMSFTLTQYQGLFRFSSFQCSYIHTMYEQMVFLSFFYHFRFAGIYTYMYLEWKKAFKH